MIHIDITKLQLPDGWQEKSVQLKTDLEACANHGERKKIIDDNATHWGELYKALSDLSNGKCWYSEAQDIFSKYDIDHFRPKLRARGFAQKDLDDFLNGKVNTIRGKSNRDGYWWLAFNWNNYRLVGMVGNRRTRDKLSSEDDEVRGKGDYFPLRIGTAPCIQGQDLRDEDIYLLDPTDDDDPDLLTFDVEGKAIPSSQKSTWDYERAKISIELYHLNYQPLVDRRKELWIICQRNINAIEKIKTSLKSEISTFKRATLAGHLRELREMIKPEKELSSVVTACLLESPHRWARKIASR